MLINVFNSVSFEKESIDSSIIDPKVHFHVNRQDEFSVDELASFGYEASVAKKAKKVVEPVVEAPVETPVEEVV